MIASRGQDWFYLILTGSLGSTTRQIYTDLISVPLNYDNYGKFQVGGESVLFQTLEAGNAKILVADLGWPIFDFEIAKTIISEADLFAGCGARVFSRNVNKTQGFLFQKFL